MKNLIDRDAAVAAAVAATVDWHRLANPQVSEAYCIGKALRELPTIEARQSGRWVIHSDEYGYIVNCSKCGNGYASRKKWNPVAEEYERPSLSPYCPCCGAYMENA